ncbi:MAG: undecaprenyl/decaprenyl-phosphate alpha-N-acetylglucosaminyl 1-phosphate transferase [Gammaproteobacteria bacterium]|nr:undecaprenyl/decaprenyl-phosphate alpha-N-acetylglucosaminyl 1-phosphate transferase [Gammaproteobacteria bacterium]
MAARTDFYDHPGGYKEHARSTPYLGGLAVTTGFLVAAIIFGWASDEVLVLVLGVLVLLAVGTADDRVGLGIIPRILIEVGVAAAVWFCGFGWDLFSSGALDFLFTIAWVVGLINAFNLMDNLDGATATVAAASAAGAGGLALAQGGVLLAAVGFSLAGACAGFLPHNLAKPAKTFLGDGGSMPVGFAIAVITMTIPFGSGSLIAFALACLVVAVPILDMAAVIISRRQRGVGVFVGGRDHMTHRLFRYIDSERGVSAVLFAAQGSLCGLAVVLIETSRGVLVVAVSAFSLVLAALALAYLETLATGIPKPGRGDT